MDRTPPPCSDCSTGPNRRDFLRASAAAALAGAGLPLFATPKAAVAAPAKTSAPETAVKALFDSLTAAQKKDVCFAYDYTEKARGLLRTHVSNNWQITKHKIRSEFYTAKQQGIIADIFKGLTNPEWHERLLKQAKEDGGGEPSGAGQSVAIFGEPGSDKFEFVLTGRHQTLRADGNTEGHVAFGGPIFYGHAGKGFNEKPDHPGNIFWPQAVAANKVYKMLDERQRKAALVGDTPGESEVAFTGNAKGKRTGIPVTELASDQKTELQKVLAMLVEPFRKDDREEALACLKAQGGLDGCHLSFYSDEDIGDDGVWDNWRLEGPAFVWYFRGNPHVHVWVNVADDPAVKLNARG